MHIIAIATNSFMFSKQYSDNKLTQKNVDTLF